MTSREPRELLEDIVASARLALRYVESVEFAAFDGDREKQDAVIHRLEMIGEAAGKLPEEVTSALPQVPWPKIRSMRNLLVHQYWDVSSERVWAVVRNELEPLVSAIEGFRA